ncbi:MULTISPECIES: hypothetical protein [Gordonia]|uniref:hypothetical protein n=1 Tax=Gordonia TaxID=2053 RepID=UPI0007845692|nr:MULTISPECIES: hypothetical protein [Gordonia]WFN94151.1 hypothetical protein P5P27_06290 [Gordonia sihwensis]WFN94212.1 hypothetical protein P5P27_06600 [Gordonia sihwensis]
MARDYAQIRLDIWGDDEWRKLTPGAQHLYFALLTSPTMTYCGVVDWRPGRIAAGAAGWSAMAVRAAAAELIDGLFIVVDEDTEEALIRSFVKHDGLLRNPKVSVSMANAFAAVASSTLRGVIVHQLHRLRDAQPDLKAWGVEKVTEILDRESIDPSSLLDELGEGFGVEDGDAYPEGQGDHLGERYPLGLGEGLPHHLPQGLGEGLGVTQGETDPQGLGVDSLPAPAPAPTASSIVGGYVTGERHLESDTDRDDPPPRNCPDHLGDPNPPNCRACGEARQRLEAWQARRAELANEARKADLQRQAEVERAAIDRCDLCNDDGYRGGRVCDHDPEADERNARGIAAAREALAARKRSDRSA